MNVQIDVRDCPAEDLCVATVRGRVYWIDAGELERRLAEAFRSGPSTFIVDLRALSFIAAGGLAVLVRAHRRLRDEGRVLQMVQPGEPVLGVFRVTGLMRVLAIGPVGSEMPEVVAEAGSCCPLGEPAAA